MKSTRCRWSRSPNPPPSPCWPRAPSACSATAGGGGSGRPERSLGSACWRPHDFGNFANTADRRAQNWWQECRVERRVNCPRADRRSFGPIGVLALWARFRTFFVAGPLLINEHAVAHRQNNAFVEMDVVVGPNRHSLHMVRVFPTHRRKDDFPHFSCTHANLEAIEFLSIALAENPQVIGCQRQ